MQMQPTSIKMMKKCRHNVPLVITSTSDIRPCICCGQDVGFTQDEECKVCRLGIERSDVPEQSIPDDYILDRGPVHQVFADERIIEETSPGYYKLLLGATGIKSTFTTLSNIMQLPWPYEDGTVTEAEIGSIVCRMPLYTLIDIMCEIHRVLVPQGLLTISTPFYLHDSYIRDLRNITPICEDTFGFFSKTWCNRNKVEPYTDKCDFKPAGIRYHSEDEWLPRADSVKNWARAHYWGVVKKIEVVLRAIK